MLAGIAAPETHSIDEKALRIATRQIFDNYRIFAKDYIAGKTCFCANNRIEIMDRQAIFLISKHCYNVLDVEETFVAMLFCLSFQNLQSQNQEQQLQPTNE